ncbi:MAG: HAMP domain-containing sensor histidine kinase [Acidobacteriota bacterium]
MRALVLEFARAALRWRTYSPSSPYVWFGFAWGLPVPIFCVAIDCYSRGAAITPAAFVEAVHARPWHVFFLLHPLLFAGLFAVLGAVRQEKSDQLGRLVSRLEASLASTSFDNETLKRLQGSRDEEIALLTHELKNPLAAIRGYSELLLAGDLGPLDDRQKRAVQSCLRGADRLNEMINDMLAASALDAGLLDVAMAPCALRPIAESAVRAFAPIAARQGIRLEVDVPADLAGLADAGRLEHVLGNLVSNAVKHVAQGGSVVVRARPEGGSSVRLSVVDDGCGMSAETIAHLGERFRQPDRESGREGTGLGLYIVKGILERHGTALDVASREGAGTTMSFRLGRSAAVAI